MTVVPGCPSLLRPMKPRSLAMARVHQDNGGGSSGGGFLSLETHSTFHSSSVNRTSHGISGVSRPCLVSQWMRQATTMCVTPYL